MDEQLKAKTDKKQSEVTDSKAEEPTTTLGLGPRRDIHFYNGHYYMTKQQLQEYNNA